MAELLQVSENTVTRWRYDGDLAYVRLSPRLVRFRREDIDRHVVRHRTDTFDPASGVVGPVETQEPSPSVSHPAAQNAKRVRKAKAPAKRRPVSGE